MIGVELAGHLIQSSSGDSQDISWDYWDKDPCYFILDLNLWVADRHLFIMRGPKIEPTLEKHIQEKDNRKSVVGNVV